MATLVEHNEYWSYHLVAQLCFYEGAKSNLCNTA